MITPKPNRFSVALKGWPGKPFWAVVDSSVRAKVTLNAAVRLVDLVMPQVYRPYGGTYYSFIRREFLLNLLLFHYERFGYFPSGRVHIVHEALQRRLPRALWWLWLTFKEEPRRYGPGEWIDLPRLVDIGCDDDGAGSSDEPVSSEN